MGIRGLLEFLYQQSDLHELMLEKIADSSRLLIDGNNFMFYLMGLLDKDENFIIDRRFGGSFKQFYNIIESKLEKLKKFQLEVYFDGEHQSTFKNEIKHETSVQKKKNYWKKLFFVLRNHRKVINQTELPIPIMTSLFFKIILAEKKIAKIKFCEGEADIDIAKNCREYNSAGQKAYAYSNDTDFFAMRDCPTIKFHSLLENVKIQVGTIEVEVWKRSALSKLLGFMDQSQFVDFCILVGCDFTKHFSRNKFYFVCNSDAALVYNSDGFTDKQSVHSILSAVKDILSQRPGLKLDSADFDLKRRIEYSRSFYEGNIEKPEIDLHEEEDHQEENRSFQQVDREEDDDDEDEDEEDREERSRKENGNIEFSLPEKISVNYGEQFETEKGEVESNEIKDAPLKERGKIEIDYGKANEINSKKVQDTEWRPSLPKDFRNQFNIFIQQETASNQFGKQSIGSRVLFFLKTVTSQNKIIEIKKDLHILALNTMLEHLTESISSASASANPITSDLPLPNLKEKILKQHRFINN